MQPETRAAQAKALWTVLRQAAAEPSSLTASHLAEVSGYHRDHLDRMSSEFFGVPIGSVLVRFRLERAAHELVEGQIKVGQAAAQAGYSSAEAFIKEFRKRYGVSPGRVREESSLPPKDRVSWASVRAGCVEFGDGRFVEAGPIRVAGRLHVGDYRGIPAAWGQLARTLPERLTSDQGTRWVTVFHSDGMREHDRGEMRAHLGFVLQGQPLPAGFEVVEIPGCLMVQSPNILGPSEHGKRWQRLNGLWVPKRRAAKPLQPGMDEYTAIPADWNKVRPTISLAIVS